MNITAADFHAMRLWHMRREWVPALWETFPDSLLPYREFLTIYDVSAAVNSTQFMDGFDVHGYNAELAASIAAVYDQLFDTARLYMIWGPWHDPSLVEEIQHEMLVERTLYGHLGNAEWDELLAEQSTALTEVISYLQDDIGMRLTRLNRAWRIFHMRGVNMAFFADMV